MSYDVGPFMTGSYTDRRNTLPVNGFTSCPLACIALLGLDEGHGCRSSPFSRRDGPTTPELFEGMPSARAHSRAEPVVRQARARPVPAIPSFRTVAGPDGTAGAGRLSVSSA